MALSSFSPIRLNKTSFRPVSGSKRQEPFFSTSGIGNGQFSEPIYRVTDPLAFRPRRCAQDVGDALAIVALHGLEKCLAGLRGRRKRCPSRLLSKPLASAAKRQHHKDRQRERRRSGAFR